MITTRHAEPGDIPWLARQLEAFSGFYGTRIPLWPADRGEAEQLVRELFHRHHWFVATEQASDVAVPERVGFIAGALTDHPFNPRITVLSELFWWVVPQHRGGSAGARLLRRFVAFGQEYADWTVMTLEAQSPVNPRSLERMGFRLYESSYLLEH